MCIFGILGVFFWYFRGILGANSGSPEFQGGGVFFRYFSWKFRVGPSRGSVAGRGVLKHTIALGNGVSLPQTYHAIVGGKTYHRVRPPKPVLEASESGICLVCAGFLKGKQQGENKRGGGKTYHRWGGGPKPVLGRVVMVCFPLP